MNYRNLKIENYEFYKNSESLTFSNQNDIAICLNCYYNSNISKLILQLSSLLMKGKYELIDRNKEFQHINECVDYLKSLKFEKCNELNQKNKIHIALYCDGLSGRVYKDINDFKNRIDIKEFNEIFKDTIFNLKDLKVIPYFIYINCKSLFPEITNEINKFIKQNNTNIEQQLKLFKYKYDLNLNIDDNIIFDNIDFDLNKPNFIIYNYIYMKYFKNINYSNKIQKIKDKYQQFKLSYATFIELYQLQPELFINNIKEYFKSKFINNYSDNIKKIKQIFNEFHEIYNNSSLQGTYYHTNLMINRTRFLNDFDDKFKFFIDDDDFTGGLDNYFEIYNWYINDVKIDYLKLNKIIKYIDLNKSNKLNMNKNNELTNRKYIKQVIENNINKPLGRYLYISFMKYCIYKFNVWNGSSIQNNICAIWNDIIPPYLPLNFLNVKETRCEDSSFNSLHFATNFINNQTIVYYYNLPSLHNYNRDKNYITELKIRSIFNYLHKNNLNYLKMNYGRWFYDLNDEIEFIDFKNKIKNVKICDYENLNEIE